jgi:hypothetical protein
VNPKKDFKDYYKTLELADHASYQEHHTEKIAKPEVQPFEQAKDAQISEKQSLMIEVAEELRRSSTASENSELLKEVPEEFFSEGYRLDNEFFKITNTDQA